MTVSKKKRSGRVRDGLGYVALWQFLTFVLLLLIIWINETVDLAALWFKVPPRPPDTFRACVVSAGVMLTALIAIGTTYEQQKRIIRGLLTVCAQCRRIRLQDEVWAYMDDYVTEHSLALITHGLCPDCFEKVKASIAGLEKSWQGATSDPRTA